ncbi:MAG TPA: DUF4623 domain-containing protein, partial [Lacipirellula sp.]
MNAIDCRIAGLALVLFAAPLVQGATLTPLDTFGGGDGWRAPFEVLPGDSAAAIVNDPAEGDRYQYLGNALTNTSVNAGNLERGFAYNPATGNLILVSRQGPNGGSIRILNGTSGVDVGELPKDPAIVTGGNFANNMVGVADDGAIYVGNLSTNTSSSPFKIYRWANETAAATVAYTGLGPTAPLDGARLGDSLDVFGSGANTRL